MLHVLNINAVVSNNMLWANKRGIQPVTHALNKSHRLIYGRPSVTWSIGMVDIVSFAHSLVIVRTEAVFVSLYSLVVSRWWL